VVVEQEVAVLLDIMVVVVVPADMRVLVEMEVINFQLLPPAPAVAEVAEVAAPIIEVQVAAV
jgi:hypothetical protein